MNNVLFQKCITPANKTQDGEPEIIRVTKEVNCILVWVSAMETHEILKTFHSRDEAIEWAVIHGPTEAKACIEYNRATKSTREQVQP